MSNFPDKPLIAGVGMIPFTKPGQSGAWDTTGANAARLASQDTAILHEDLALAVAGYLCRHHQFLTKPSLCGQTVQIHVGSTVRRSGEDLVTVIGAPNMSVVSGSAERGEITTEEAIAIFRERALEQERRALARTRQQLGLGI